MTRKIGLSIAALLTTLTFGVEGRACDDVFFSNGCSSFSTFAVRQRVFVEPAFRVQSFRSRAFFRSDFRNRGFRSRSFIRGSRFGGRSFIRSRGFIGGGSGVRVRAPFVDLDIGF